MQVRFFCTWWGLNHLGMEKMLLKIKDAGYDGVEIGIPEEVKEQERLKALLHDYKLQVIAHQYQAHGNTPNRYLESFRKSLERAVQFGPLLINSHTGKDFWPIEENLKAVKIGEQLEERYKIPIVHETHRGRFLYSASVGLHYFERAPNLKINFDLSHWCCVSESLLENQSTAVSKAIERAGHIHARVGHAQGPQISDMTHPYWNTEIATFLGWWKRIYQRFKKEGKECLTITPEFGPLPYSPLAQNGNTSYIDFFEQNKLMKQLLEEQLLKTDMPKK